MLSERDTHAAGTDGLSGQAEASHRLQPPLPLFLVQPLLRHIVTTVGRNHPDLFDRLGTSQDKRFLIDPKGLPLTLLLEPRSAAPRLTAYGRRDRPAHDVHISGSLGTLLRMIDGETDSDALFFNRDLLITGDTEAVVALRNALDDMDSTLAQDVIACFGPLAKPVKAIMDYAARSGSPSR
ncbi:ubiquinone anaerobic biosynthesis accessory factor UbiT [Coralliovum pocilloporae]|uniref:ubiquinone anaerobic biosynthesis accessory factor UbiT n=1 Tax=Coralliovum pocilloporae TaxID=3066369 RepID=UPI003306A1C5